MLATLKHITQRKQQTVSQHGLALLASQAQMPQLNLSVAVTSFHPTGCRALHNILSSNLAWEALALATRRALGEERVVVIMADSGWAEGLNVGTSQGRPGS